MKLLRQNGKISRDVILMADEMYLQKSTQFAGGEYVGADADGNLYTGLVSFMVVGMKENVPYVIKAFPEVSISGSWLSDQMDECIGLLADNDFNIRAVVTDNHSANVNACSIIETKVCVIRLFYLSS